MNLGDYLQWERKVGKPIYQRDGLTIRPISRVLSVWWRPYGGAVWNRPSAVEVELDGIIEEVPIVPVTLLAVAGVWMVVAFVGLLMWMAGGRRSP